MENGQLELFFGEHDHLFIRQVKEWGEILTGFETRNRYQIFNKNNVVVGFCAEQGSGVSAFFKRIFLRNHRPMDILVFNKAGEVILNVERPFYWFFSTMTIKNPAGRVLGVIEQQFSIFRKKYDLFQGSRQFATINSGYFRFFTFEIENNLGHKIGVITKKWGGFLKELFTDADSFGVEFSDKNLSIEQKAIIFCNSISIDMDYFENNTGNNRGFLD